MTADRPDFGVLIALANVTFARELREHMRREGFDGFTTRTGFVLRVLTDRPQSLRALAGELRMTSQATLKIVDTMTDDDLVERTASPADRRLRLVAVTDRGREALHAARAFHDRFEAELVGSLDAETVAAARRALGVLASRGPEGLPRAIRVGDHRA